jgi:hypothetical protein
VLYDDAQMGVVVEESESDASALLQFVGKGRLLGLSSCILLRGEPYRKTIIRVDN